jgi:protein-S-isoprenylcysteine O-methyltransferase Ste14
MLIINPWFGNAVFILGVILSILIRAPHDKVRLQTKVIETRRTGLEVFLITAVLVSGIMLPVLAFMPWLEFANYPLTLPSFILGCVTLILGLWVFHLSHKHLGRNFSHTLEVREDHSLITNGVYKYVRHPMYSALFLLGVAQACLLSNWIAGPAMLVAFFLMFAFRIGPEERMMLDRFGAQYEAYRQQTRRVIPGFW